MTKDSYLIPFKMNISRKYSLDAVKDALDGMFSVHPILGMCVSDEFEAPYLINGFRLDVVVVDDFDSVAEFLTGSFDLHNSLSRFLIVDTDDDRYVLFAVFHHIIFDALSDNVFKRDLQLILDGEVLDVDDSFLKVAAYAQQISQTEDYVDAKNFYDSMLADSDEVGVLLDGVSCDGNGFISLNLDLDYQLFNGFLDDCDVSENVLFTSVFAYTLSRFVGSDKVLFNIAENGRDRFNNFDSIGMFVNTLPLLVDCKNRDIGSFMDYMADMVYGVMKFNYYPFRFLANDYGIDSNILFQFLPDWIRDTKDVRIGNEDIVDYDILDSMGDLIADFSVEVIQDGHDYSLNVIYSEKYSCDFVNRFMQSYKLILHDMVSVGRLSDINYTRDGDVELLDGINQTQHDLTHDDILDVFNDYSY